MEAYLRLPAYRRYVLHAASVNRCVDSFAKMSFNLDVDFLFFSFNNPPMDIVDVYDLNGMYFNRICLEPTFS